MKRRLQKFRNKFLFVNIPLEYIEDMKLKAGQKVDLLRDGDEIRLIPDRPKNENRGD